jgi:metallo-beta-lactamase class B
VKKMRSGDLTAAEIKKETGAQLVAGERDKPLLEGGYYPGDEKDTDLAFPPVRWNRISTSNS